jgi:hypothetical protein
MCLEKRYGFDMSDVSLRPAALILAFVRIDGVRKLIESCLQNDVKRIYISIDGPKDFEGQQIQLSIVRMVNEFKANSDGIFRLLHRDNNLGVGAGVIAGIDWFFSQESVGYILEDDLAVGSDFFSFSFEALSRYKDDDMVKMVAGSQMLTDLNKFDGAYWCNYPIIWGWSTWRDKWYQMKEGLLREKSLIIGRGNPIVNNFWTVGANRVLNGYVDTWDTPLAAEFRVKNWLCLVPPVNLVSNTGNDSYATNTKGIDEFLNLKITNLIVDTDFEFNRNYDSIRKYNRTLEKNIFKIKPYHLLIPLYSLLFDSFRFRVRKSQLKNRIVEA